jgi:predicted MFS family arabinose efflux permease
MVKRTLQLYKDSFMGLSPEIWWLALITFINRAGTMVIPFLAVYLTKHLEFSLPQVGTIMSAFGLGSFLGSFLGGKLTDKIGYHKVMFWSLLLTGFLFIGLQYVTTFYGFVIAILLIMTVADTFRPALYVSLNAYSNPENQTRSLTLLRLAINLGFSFGPVLGGLIITGLSYKGLFWIDGITCILAIVLFKFVLKDKEFIKKDKEVEDSNINKSVFKDKPYWIFLAIVFLMGFTFMQLFSTIPLFYVNVYNLTEFQIGLLMSLNGMLIFLTEMPLIH